MIKLTAALLLICCAVAHANSVSDPITVNVVPITGTGISPDGSKIAGGTGQLVTGDGTWTFGAAASSPPGNWQILLNGSSVDAATGSELEVANGGGAYLFGGDGNWYKRVNKHWLRVGNPTPPPPIASITVDNLTPKAGDTITVTYDPKTSTTSPSDRIQLSYVSPQWTCNVPVASGGSSPDVSVPVPSATPGPHTFSLRIPMVPSDVPQHYRVELWQVVTGTSIPACQGGGLNDMAVAATPTITVAPTITATYPPPPASLTYPPPGWPASPNETITVCESGCQFNNLTDVSNYVQFTDANRDWIKVDVQSGDYISASGWANPAPCSGLPGGKCIEHIWFYGHGVTRPHITCTTELPYFFPYSFCSGILSAAGIHNVFDNFDVGPTVKAGANSPAMGPTFCEGTPTDFDTTLFRNLYLHDGGNGMLGNGECKYEVTFQNSHVARFGGPIGPAHDVYFNDFAPKGSPFPAVIYDGHLVINNSVFELAEIGHTVKSHANRLDINCSQLTNGTSEDYSGSQTIDMDGGGGQVTVNNSLVVGGQYFYNSFANSPWFMEFGGDKSSWSGDQPKQFVVFNNSYIINDRNGFMLALSAPMTPDASLPYKSSNNVFIGSWDDSGTPSACGGALPCTSPASKWDLGRWADMDFGCPLASNGANDCRSFRDTGNKSSTGNLFFTTRAAARAHNWPSSASPIQDLPTRTDQGGTVYTAWPYDPKLYPMPTACTDPVGNVQWPL
jgi:hypothetical protein